MKKLLFAIILTLSILVSGIYTYAYSGLPETVKIGLYFGSSALSEATIACDGDIIVYYDSQEVLRAPNLLLKVENNLIDIYSNGTWLYRCDDKELKFAKTSGYISINGKEYRGSLQAINLKNGKMTIVNKVPVEEYLYGVVSKEMSTGFPFEALKAQAVCARTYAAGNIGRFSAQGFDMTNTTLSQVYGGLSAEEDDCTAAVNDTSGKIVTYNGKPAQIFYFSTSSGVTLNCKDVWSADLPYLTSVEDTYQSSIVPDNHAWSVTYTAAELKELLAKKGVEIGDITDLTIDEKNAQGAVLKLTFTGTNGSKTYQKESTRLALNLISQVFDITSNKSGAMLITSSGTQNTSGSVSALTANGTETVSNLTVLSANGQQTLSFAGDDSYKVSGTGYGHGVGMSQNGAKGMAKAGFNYEQILTYYFQGTAIQ